MVFARRSTRTNRRNIGGVVPATAGNGYPTTGSLAPLGLIQSRTALGYWHADLGVSEADAAGRVSAWANQTGGEQFVMATAAAQPGLGDAVLNGHDVISGNGADRFLTSALTLPAPNATPTFGFCIFRQNAWANGARLFAGSAATSFKVGGSTSTPNLNLNNGNAGPLNNGAVIDGTWFRMRFLFSSTTADYLLIGSVNATGTDLGDSVATSIALFALTTGASFGAYSIAAFGLWNGDPTPAEHAAVDAWIPDEWGAGVGL